jgi:outer membrane protein assembly factor BamD
MKKNRILIFGFLALATLLASSCASPLDKIKKSTDFKMKYEKALEYYGKGDYSTCQQLLDDVMPFYRGTKDAEKLAWHYANCSYNMKEYLSASYYFKQFNNTFPNSEYAEESTYMIANALYKLSPDLMLDQENTIKAIEAYQVFINTYPNSKRVEDCNKAIDGMREKLYRKDFDSAVLYFKIADYRAAVHALRNLLKNYPDAADAESARFMIVKAHYYMAQNSIETKQMERYQETVNAYNELMEQHPKGGFAKDAQKYFELATERIKQLKS